MVRLVLTRQFEKDISKIKDEKVKQRIKNTISKIIEDPEIGKHLRYNFKGCYSIRISTFRIIYTIKEDCIYLIKFKHRKEVYR